ncbi:uncharacterized protein CLUP02_02808 [Colletotrichum lupini]|uniref:Uncharacterized protein n=1 Tax=Colletotrichum lupini TaxID=145971 RepID=A0A9Q8SHN1_9PEZI|nr:uncharacterized protein CLUP02_02808 [Colletotrichum lupini]UQC77340.1 hypothetical protein CLUP02_02808 [Colletotrichum lupini]
MLWVTRHLVYSQAPTRSRAGSTPTAELQLGLLHCRIEACHCDRRWFMHKAGVDRQHRDKASLRLGAKAATAPMTLAHWIDFLAHDINLTRVRAISSHSNLLQESPKLQRKRGCWRSFVEDKWVPMVFQPSILLLLKNVRSLTVTPNLELQMLDLHPNNDPVLDPFKPWLAQKEFSNQCSPRQALGTGLVLLEFLYAKNARKRPKVTCLMLELACISWLSAVSKEHLNNWLSPYKTLTNIETIDSSTSSKTRMISERKRINNWASHLVEPFFPTRLQHEFRSSGGRSNQNGAVVNLHLQASTPLQPRAFADRLGADPLMPAGRRVQAMQPLRSSPPARAGGQTLNKHHLQPMEHTIVIPVPGVEDQDHRHAALSMSDSQIDLVFRCRRADNIYHKPRQLWLIAYRDILQPFSDKTKRAFGHTTRYYGLETVISKQRLRHYAATRQRRYTSQIPDVSEMRRTGFLGMSFASLHFEIENNPQLSGLIRVHGDRNGDSLEDGE